MSNGITQITYADDITLITLSSLPCDSKAVADVLTAMSDSGVNVDMISQTAPQGGTIRLSFTLSDEALGTALSVLSKLPAVKPEILPGNCKIALYDANMVNTPGVAANVFTLLANAGVQVILVTTSEVDISILVSAHSLPDALAVMNAAYSVEPQQNEF